MAEFDDSWKERKIFHRVFERQVVGRQLGGSLLQVFELGSDKPWSLIFFGRTDVTTQGIDPRSIVWRHLPLHWMSTAKQGRRGCLAGTSHGRGQVVKENAHRWLTTVLHMFFSFEFNRIMRVTLPHKTTQVSDL